MTISKTQIKITKISNCPVCNSFSYALPIPVEPGIAKSLSIIGDPLYPLDKFKLFKIETEAIVINGMIGKNDIKVKFKKNAVSMSAVFRAALLEWVEARVGPAEFIGTV